MVAIKPKLGRIIPLHQMWEGTNVCMYCGKPFYLWGEGLEECKANPNFR